MFDNVSLSCQIPGLAAIYAREFPGVKEISEIVKVWQPNLTVEISQDGGGMIAIYPTKRKRDMKKKLELKVVKPAPAPTPEKKADEKSVEKKSDDTHKWERPPVLPGGRSA